MKGFRAPGDRPKRGPTSTPLAGKPAARAAGFLCATAHGRPRRGRKRRAGYPPDPTKPAAREARPPRPAPARQGATARQASRPAEIPPRALLNRRRRERQGPRGNQWKPPWGADGWAGSWAHTGPSRAPEPLRRRRLGQREGLGRASQAAPKAQGWRHVDEKILELKKFFWQP